MKKIIMFLPFVALSCTSELVLPTEGADTVLVVNGSLCSSDTLHTITIVSSSAARGIVSPPETVKLTLYVNGIREAVCSEPEKAKLYMKSRDYILRGKFAPGDDLYLTVESELGVCEVSGTAPALPDVLSVSYGDKVNLTYDDYGNRETKTFLKTFLTLADPGGERNAYRVNIQTRAQYVLVKEIRPDFGFKPGYTIELGPKSLDVFNLLEPAMRLPWNERDSVNDFNMCSDDSFDGQRYTLTLCLKMGTWGANTYSLGFNPPIISAYYDPENDIQYSELWCMHQWLDIKFESIPYDTWRYFMAVEYDSNGPALPIVYEPTLFPSNVKGGLGYVSISSATISTIQLPDVYFDVDHYPGGYIK